MVAGQIDATTDGSLRFGNQVVKHGSRIWSPIDVVTEHDKPTVCLYLACIMLDRLFQFFLEESNSAVDIADRVQKIRSLFKEKPRPGCWNALCRREAPKQPLE